jgi:hypothetical protein
MRARQARLLLEINGIVAEIRDAPATTIEDFMALLDVALEHEIDLAADIAFYGLSDYPMIARLLRALACTVPDPIGHLVGADHVAPAHFGRLQA